MKTYETKGSHGRCPLRQLEGGRCKKTCPFWERQRFGTCDGLVGIDHEKIREDESGNKVFVSSHHFDPRTCPEFCTEWQEFAAYAGYRIEVVEYPVKNGVRNYNVIFVPPRTIGRIRK